MPLLILAGRRAFMSYGDIFSIYIFILAILAKTEKFVLWFWRWVLGCKKVCFVFMKMGSWLYKSLFCGFEDGFLVVKKFVLCSWRWVPGCIKVITSFLTRLAWQMPLVEQELLTLREHLASLWFFVLHRVAQSLVFCVVFCWPLFVFLTFLTFGHCIVWPLIYSFWFPNWYLQAFLVGHFTINNMCCLCSSKKRSYYALSWIIVHIIIILQWNLSNPTHQGTGEMCQIVQDVRTCLICHIKGPGKCVRLYRMSEPV